MTAVAEAPTALPIDVSPVLIDAVVSTVPNALAMCGVKASCVGMSRMPSRPEGEITGMIGVHGSTSGFISVNMSRRLGLHVVDGLLGDTNTDLTPQVIDGTGEVTNIIVGGIKSALSNTEWSFAQITVPSVIVGEGYQVAFAKGIELLDVAFECNNDKAIAVNDRLLRVTLSLLKV